MSYYFAEVVVDRAYGCDLNYVTALVIVYGHRFSDVVVMIPKMHVGYPRIAKAFYRDKLTLSTVRNNILHPGIIHIGCTLISDHYI